MGGTRAPDVVVIGAGQAGLAASHGLSVRGIEHVVLERARGATTWCYLEGYAASAPVREGIAVQRLDRSPDGALRLTTCEGQLRAGLAPPPLPDPEPFRAPIVEELPLGDFGAVLFTAGFRPRYTDWVDLPVFDGDGFPVTTDGVTKVPGLYFCGVHFMRTRHSALLFGVGDDAELVAGSIAARLG